MATSDTNVPQVIVNKLTMADYTTATKNANEFYAVTDLDGVYAETVAPITAVGAITTNNIADGAVTSTKIGWSSLPLYHKTVTATTNNDGFIDSVLSANYVPINIFVRDSNNARHVAIMSQGNPITQYAVRIESTTHSAVTNKSVTLEIYYMDKTKFNEA